MAAHREVVILPLQGLGPVSQALHGGGAVLAAQDLEPVNHLCLNSSSLDCFCTCASPVSSQIVLLSDYTFPILDSSG